MGMYVVTLIAVDRYVLPAYPIMLANIFIVPALLWHRRESEKQVSEVAAQSFAATG